MQEGKEIQVQNTSIYYPMFQYIFEMADVTSSFWQPLLTSIGRTHLEVAGLQARQTRALVHWTHQLMRPTMPADIFRAHAEFWGTIVQDYADAAPRVAAAVETAAEAVVAPAVVPMPVLPVRDTLILLDRDEQILPERKVA
ncbi:MAG: hypothetical protein ABWX70_01690 [Hyphomicrobium sp.]